MADGQECMATDGTLASYTKQVGLQVRYQPQYQRQAMHQDRNNESSNKLHYSNASSIGKSRRYLVIKGGACLVALARERDRQHRSRTGQQQRRSRCLAREEGEETINI